MKGDHARLHRCRSNHTHFAGMVNHPFGQTQHRTRPEAIDVITLDAHKTAADDQISLFNQTACRDNFLLRLKHGGLEQSRTPKAQVEALVTGQ